MEHNSLTNMQMELLRLYSQNLSLDELNDVKRILAKYFADKAMNEADKIWKEKKYSDDYMDELLKKK